MKKQRRHYTPEEKVAILRRHLLDKEPISKLCGEVFATDFKEFIRISGMTHVRTSPYTSFTLTRQTSFVTHDRGWLCHLDLNFAPACCLDLYSQCRLTARSGRQRSPVR